MEIKLTLYWPSATRTTFLEQEHLDTWCLICVIHYRHNAQFKIDSASKAERIHYTQGRHYLGLNGHELKQSWGKYAGIIVHEYSKEHVEDFIWLLINRAGSCSNSYMIATS